MVVADAAFDTSETHLSSFITYAQNFEDLMLWRALHDVKVGFYIDVGAADPDEDSVTRAFYDRGWRGINIEPTPEYFEALVAARPRDITLRCLAGAALGEAELYHFADTQVLGQQMSALLLSVWQTGVRSGQCMFRCGHSQIYVENIALQISIS
jgi:hypothetical protein